QTALLHQVPSAEYAIAGHGHKQRFQLQQDHGSDMALNSSLGPDATMIPDGSKGHTNQYGLGSSMIFKHQHGLSALAKTASTILNRNGGNGHPATDVSVLF
ncbi:transmembrane protease serine 11B-like protein, partial [Cricetulus griseus]